MSETIAITPRPRPGRFRRVIFPLLVVALAGVGVALPRLWERADFDPAPLIPMNIVGMFAVPAALILLTLWLLGLSGFRWRTKFAVLGGVAALGIGFAACVDHVDLDGNMRLIPVYKWQTRPRVQAVPIDTTGLPPTDLTIDPVRDYPRYRGADADGQVRGVVLDDWKFFRPRELWRRPCGGGFAGFAVVGNVLVTVEQRDSKEAVVCYDRESGRERWVHSYEAEFRHPTGGGPRATPTIAVGEVYSLGATGWLVCLDGRTGERKWGKNILEDNGAKNITWALTGSPLIMGKNVVVNAGVDPDHNVNRALVAYDRATGDRVWAAGGHKAGYSSPQSAKLAGREQVLLFDAGGLAGFDAKDGKELWRYPWETFNDMNIMQPLVKGDRVLISSEADRGCAMLQVRLEGGKFTAEPDWANRSLCARFCNPVRVGSSIYGLSTGFLVCLDAETGARRWRSSKTFGSGQILAVDARLLIQSEFGDLVLVAADPERYRELGRVTVSDAPKTWNTPAMAGNRLYLRNHLEMACYELPEGGR